MSGFQRRQLIVTILVVCGAAVPARAQAPATTPPPTVAQNGPGIDLSAGYLNVSGSMHGGNIQMSREFGRRWSLVGEFNASRGSDPGDDNSTYRDLAGLVGVRQRWQPTAKVSPFWQVLAGGLHSTAEDYYVDYCCGLGRRYQEGFTVNYFALQPGGGVTVMLTPRFGIRAQADMQLAIPDQSDWEGFSIFPRAVVGGVIRLGR